MADMKDGDVESSPEEQLRQKHRKERKELQSQIQKLKSGVSKGDKKKKKEVMEQIAKMESDLNSRQDKELAEIESQAVDDKVAERLQNLTTEESTNHTSQETVKEKKPSKAQKRREKKSQQDREREEMIKEQEVENLSGARNLEFNKIKSLLKDMNLQIYEIPSDGNCLYQAVAHQLNVRGGSTSNEELRQRCAKYLRAHCEDFLPFLAKDNGDLYSEEEYEKYCDDVAMTTAWGGHLEIRALSHALQQPIKIIQGEGPPIKMGEEFENSNQSIVLCYHRHAFGLGEHYNSVDKYTEEKTEFE